MFIHHNSFKIIRLIIAVILTVLLITGCTTKKKDWETAQSTDSISAYENFLKKHAKSEFTEQARSRLEQLYAQKDWKETQLLDSIPAYEHFLKQHPQSEFTQQAHARIEQLYVNRDWKQARSSDDIAAYERFLRQHPKSEFVSEARFRLDQLSAIEVYYFRPEFSPEGSTSSNIEVEEVEGRLRVRMTGEGEGHLASIIGFGGQPKFFPDALGSFNIHVVVNEQMGYTTLCGLKFLNNVIINIWGNGIIEADKEGIKAKDQKGIQYVSQRIKFRGKNSILMVKGDVIKK